LWSNDRSTGKWKCDECLSYNPSGEKDKCRSCEVARQSSEEKKESEAVARLPGGTSAPPPSPSLSLSSPLTKIPRKSYKTDEDEDPPPPKQEDSTAGGGWGDLWSNDRNTGKRKCDECLSYNPSGEKDSKQCRRSCEVARQSSSDEKKKSEY
jgi:hypothetical protein